MNSNDDSPPLVAPPPLPHEFLAYKSAVEEMGAAIKMSSNFPVDLYLKCCIAKKAALNSPYSLGFCYRKYTSRTGNAISVDEYKTRTMRDMTSEIDKILAWKVAQTPVQTPTSPSLTVTDRKRESESTLPNPKCRKYKDVTPIDDETEIDDPDINPDDNDYDPDNDPDNDPDYADDSDRAESPADGMYKKYTGVFKKHNRWLCNFTIDGKQRAFRFDTNMDAALAREIYIIDHNLYSHTRNFQWIDSEIQHWRNVLSVRGILIK